MESQSFMSRVAGTSFNNPNGSSREEYIRTYCKPGMPLLFRPEPDNPRDPRAIALFVLAAGGPVQIGYVTSNALPTISEALAEKWKVNGVIEEITGGTAEKPNIGVNYKVNIAPPHAESPKGASKNTACAIWIIVILLLLGCILVILVVSPKTKSDLSRCVPASAVEIDLINYGLAVVGNDLWISNAWAVKSNDYKNVWMVAGFINGNGKAMEGGVGPGVWAHGGDQDAPRTVLAIGGFAHQFSSWGPGETTDAEIRITSDGAQEAVQCAEANRP